MGQLIKTNTKVLQRNMFYLHRPTGIIRIMPHRNIGINILSFFVCELC